MTSANVVTDTELGDAIEDPTEFRAVTVNV